GFQIMNRLMERAKSSPKRVVFAEGEEPKILRAAAQLVEQGIAEPIVLGRKGMSVQRALGRMITPNYFGLMMVEQGDADAFLSGLTYDYGSVIRPALEIVGVREGVKRACGAYILLAAEVRGSSLKARPYFLTDATVNIDPTAEDLAEAAILVAELARELDTEPRIAMLSFSNFGSVRHPQAEKMRRAAEIVRERRPDLAVDGEMQADTAVVAEIVEQRYPFSRVTEANVLVFPS